MVGLLQNLHSALILSLLFSSESHVHFLQLTSVELLQTGKGRGGEEWCLYSSRGEISHISWGQCRFSWTKYWRVLRTCFHFPACLFAQALPCSYFCLIFTTYGTLMENHPPHFYGSSDYMVFFCSTAVSSTCSLLAKLPSDLATVIEAFAMHWHDLGLSFIFPVDLSLTLNRSYCNSSTFTDSGWICAGTQLGLIFR